MNFNDRFCSNDPEEKNLECVTCGVMAADPWRHHEWHNELERQLDFLDRRGSGKGVW